MSGQTGTAGQAGGEASKGGGAGGGGSKVEKLDKAAASADKNHSATQKVSDTKCNCVVDVPIHLGLWLQVDQYPVAGRETSVFLTAVDNSKTKEAGDFHKLTDSPYKTSSNVNALPEPPELNTLYPIKNTAAPVRKFEAGVTTKAMLVKKTGDQGYDVEETADASWNSRLGMSLAFHVRRTRTFRPTGSGNFDWKKIERVEGPSATEKFGVKVFAYVKGKLYGKPGIYPIDNGKIAPASIEEKEYTSRKLIEKPQYFDKECVSMPLIPGVHQVHVLIEEKGGSFRVTEVHCDGDRIFPE